MSRRKIRIGIELNGVVRDINTQVVKYYKKDIDKEFDDETFDKNVIEAVNNLPFKSKKAKENFLYIDYPYEVYGCAKVCSRNLSNSINNWILDLKNEEDCEYEIIFFSLKEEGLTIQSTYYFLSKIGSRVRKMFFPIVASDMWDVCDVIICSSPTFVENKPNDKVCVGIRKTDNTKLTLYSDLKYDCLKDIVDDSESFLIKLKEKLSFKEEKTKDKKWYNLWKFVR